MSQALSSLDAREAPEMLPDDVVQILASRFGIGSSRLGLKPKNGAHYLAYRLTSSQGDFALLRPRSQDPNKPNEKNALQELLRANQILLYLARHGFPVSAPIRTKEGSTTVTINGAHYALYPYVRGRAMQRGNAHHVASAGTALGSYHRIIARSPPGMSRSEEPFPERFQERLDLFCENARSLNGQCAALDIEASLGYFRERLLEIERSVIRIPYEDLPSLTIHGDYRRQNILFEGERLSAVIDFHRSRLETRSLDLAIALADIVPRVEVGAGMDLASKFVAAYQKVQPLSKNEMEAIPSLIEARIAWRVFRRVRRIVKAQNREKRLRGARRFRMYVGHLRRIEMLQSNWKRVFTGRRSQ